MEKQIDMKLTDAAKKELNRILENDTCLRISLSRSGCCGCSFNFYADRKRPGDEIFEADGYRFLITEQEKPLIRYVKELDFARSGLFRNFRAVMK